MLGAPGVGPSPRCPRELRGWAGRFSPAAWDPHRHCGGGAGTGRSGSWQTPALLHPPAPLRALPPPHITGVHVKGVQSLG